jgi:hypothetical protein
MLGVYLGIGALFNATKNLDIAMAMYVAATFASISAFIVVFMVREPVIKLNIADVNTY